MDAYFARQPILDKNLKLFGYELLFRSHPGALTSGNLPAVDGDLATISVLDAAAVSGINMLTGGAYAFVNFTKNLLLNGIPTLYPKEYLAVEILEDIQVDKKLIEAVKELKHRGYLIVLDDYIYNPETAPLIELCDIIKVEVDGSDRLYENLLDISQNVDLRRCRLLAEKVETQEIFERSSLLGCTLFQGYFFAKPKTMSNKTLGPLKLSQLRLLRELSGSDLDFPSIAKIIKNDVGLSYKTLKLVNSVYYGMRREIKNINHAIALLGEAELRKWLMFTALGSVCDTKPSELIIMSMTRAHFLEQLSKHMHKREDMEGYFLAGLFSMLDVITDTPIEICLSTLTMPPVTMDALFGKDNAAKMALDLIIALEQGKWAEVSALAEQLGLTETQISEIYYRSIDWARQFTGE